jgi:hypothetical protein
MRNNKPMKNWYKREKYGSKLLFKCVDILLKYLTFKLLNIEYSVTYIHNKYKLNNISIISILIFKLKSYFSKNEQAKIIFQGYLNFMALYPHLNPKAFIEYM